MITPAYVRAMASYNSHLNREVYAAAARLDDMARRQDRGAFWGSIQGTLSHIAWADQIWMSRFDGWERPGVSLNKSADFIADFASLHQERETMDRKLEAWAAGVEQAWLDEEQCWFSHALQQEVQRVRTVLVAHLFNHQTHHRGQAHAMITAAGETTGATDLFVVM